MDADEFMTALDAYLDARDLWEQENRDQGRVDDSTRMMVGRTRSALTEAVKAIASRPSPET